MKGFMKGMCTAGLVLIVLGLGLGVTGFIAGGSVRALNFSIINDSNIFGVRDWFRQNSLHFNRSDNRWDDDKYYVNNYDDDNQIDDDDNQMDDDDYYSTKNLMTDDAMNAATIDSLRVELGAATVTLMPSDKYSVKVKGNLPVRSEVKNGTLRIWMNNVTIFSDSNSVIAITYPKGKVYENLRLSTGASRTVVQGLSAKRAKIELGAGELVATDIVCEGKMDMDVGAASLNFSGDLQSGADIDCGMGSVQIKLSDTSDIGYKADVGMGNVSIVGDSVSAIGDTRNNESAKRFFDIDCGMGSVEIS